MRIVSRHEWGARQPKSITKLPLSRVDTIVIHYTAAFKDESGLFAARVRETQNFHMDTRGWNDIAYNFLVAKDGTIFEGRGFGVQSASTKGANEHVIAICFLGSDSANRDDVTPKGRKAIGELIREIEQRKTTKLLLHSISQKLEVKGHRDFKNVDPENNTECPGDELYNYIKLRGWETVKPIPLPPTPNWWWTWAAWYLGEGRFKKFGKANQTHRPKNVPKKIPKTSWLALAIFVANRKV